MSALKADWACNQRGLHRAGVNVVRLNVGLDDKEPPAFEILEKRAVS